MWKRRSVYGGAPEQVTIKARETVQASCGLRVSYDGWRQTQIATGGYLVFSLPDPDCSSLRKFLELGETVSFGADDKFRITAAQIHEKHASVLIDVATARVLEARVERRPPERFTHQSASSRPRVASGNGFKGLAKPIGVVVILTVGCLIAGWLVAQAAKRSSATSAEPYVGNERAPKTPELLPPAPTTEADGPAEVIDLDKVGTRLDRDTDGETTETWIAINRDRGKPGAKPSMPRKLGGPSYIIEKKPPLGLTLGEDEKFGDLYAHYWDRKVLPMKNSHIKVIRKSMNAGAAEGTNGSGTESR